MRSCSCDNTLKLQSGSTSNNGVTYSVCGSKFIVKKGKCREVIPIYSVCPTFHLTEQFKILNLYLNMQITGLASPFPVRGVEPGTNPITRYRSAGTPEDCAYMTFGTLSSEDEAHRLSRVVSPRNELIQLYQPNYTYKIEYKLRNKSHGKSIVKFLYADFSQDLDTKGAAYTLIDESGNNIDPIDVCKEKYGSFWVNGWSFPLLVKVRGDVEIGLVITGYPKEQFPPQIAFTLPVKTKFGKIQVPIYRLTQDTIDKIRIVEDNFRGINSLLRGFHFSRPNFPCFGTGPIVIQPPPFKQFATSNTKDLTTGRKLLEPSPGDMVTIISTQLAGDPKNGQVGRGQYIFAVSYNEGTINPPDSFIVFSGGLDSGHPFVNFTSRTGGIYLMEFEFSIEFASPYVPPDDQFIESNIQIFNPGYGASIRECDGTQIRVLLDGSNGGLTWSAKLPSKTFGVTGGNFAYFVILVTIRVSLDPNQGPTTIPPIVGSNFESKIIYLNNNPCIRSPLFLSL